MKAVIEKLTQQGEQIPEDVFSALIEFKQSEIDILEDEITDLREVQRKKVASASRTLAGSPGLKPKPGYRYVDSTDERGKPIQIAEEINDD
ncbi:MAG: hypothetical protein WC295_01555 [Methanoregula sp.]